MRALACEKELGAAKAESAALRARLTGAEERAARRDADATALVGRGLCLFRSDSPPQRERGMYSWNVLLCGPSARSSASVRARARPHVGEEGEKGKPQDATR